MAHSTATVQSGHTIKFYIIDRNRNTWLKKAFNKDTVLKKSKYKQLCKLRLTPQYWQWTVLHRWKMLMRSPLISLLYISINAFKTPDFAVVSVLKFIQTNSMNKKNHASCISSLRFLIFFTTSVLTCRRGTFMLDNNCYIIQACLDHVIVRVLI